MHTRFEILYNFLRRFGFKVELRPLVHGDIPFLCIYIYIYLVGMILWQEKHNKRTWHVSLYSGIHTSILLHEKHTDSHSYRVCQDLIATYGTESLKKN